MEFKVEPEKLKEPLSNLFPKELDIEDVVFVCIGTDRSTGDSLGPLVGTFLTERGFKNVIGTMDDPVHAMNLAQRIIEIEQGKTVIGIDACLGQLTSVGFISGGRGPIKPGAGVNKELPPVGDYHITGVVNVGGFMEYFVLQNTRLSLVMRMAKSVADAIESTFPMKARLEIAAAKEA